jgi:DNA-binding MarR family transcriptional regulator
MQMHEYATPSAVIPSPETLAAWTRLMRVQHKLLAGIEAELKSAGLPPLSWYDALLELSRAPGGRMRPVELERAMLLAQYSTSRLLERLVRAGLLAREPCQIDRRGQFVRITADGEALRERMWNVYAAALERHVGARLPADDARSLCRILGKLA